jgi:hypothetical protein
VELLDTRGIRYLPVRKPEDLTPCPGECWLTFPHHHFGEVAEMCYAVEKLIRITEEGLRTCACAGAERVRFRH